MSETLLVAVVGGVCSIGGAALGLIASTTKNQLEAYNLAAQMQEDNQLLWLWNRELIDHIYKQDPPPPPAPPEGLFDHND